MSIQINENTRQQRMCRVAAVIVDGDYVLLHRAEEDCFWSLPGGGCEFMEPTAEAICREMSEEMGCEVEVQRLLWVIENFYMAGGEPEHELEFCFLITLPKNPEWYDKTRIYTGLEGDLALTFQWFRIAELEQLTLYPEFLKRGLRALPEQLEHVVSWAL